MSGELQSRRPPGPCARCGHKVLIRCQPRERAARGNDYVYPYTAPLAVTFGGGDIDAPLGVLEVHVCRSCGFVDWYTLAPESIPIGVEYGTELVEVP